MVLEVHAMTEMRVQEVTENEVALQCLNEIEFGAAAEPVKQATERSHEVVNDKEQGEGAGGRRDPHPPYLLRPGIFEFDGEDGEVMLRSKGTEHG
jgi:hypothetical protein